MSHDEHTSEYRIYTDGACTGNPGKGAWAAIIVSPGGVRHELVHAYKLTTNNRMELRAVIGSLDEVPVGSHARVVSDSQYVVHAIEKRWVESWVQKSWKNSQKKPVANKDLWMTLLHALRERHVHFEWVRGHEGHPENEECDRMAVQAYTTGPWEDDAGYEGSGSDGATLF